MMGREEHISKLLMPAAELIRVHLFIGCIHLCVKFLNSITVGTKQKISETAFQKLVKGAITERVKSIATIFGVAAIANFRIFGIFCSQRVFATQPKIVWNPFCLTLPLIQSLTRHKLYLLNGQLSSSILLFKDPYAAALAGDEVNALLSRWQAVAEAQVVPLEQVIAKRTRYIAIRTKFIDDLLVIFI